jgi:hypothetical protein
VIHFPDVPQVPNVQSAPTPQKTLSGSDPVSRHVAADPQPSWPVWQGFVGVHDVVLEQAVHAPALHTSPEPQGVPSATGPIATHVTAPVEQSVRPDTQTPCEGVHGWLGVHETQTPRSQTALTPQAAPLARAVAVAVQVPAGQVRVPSKQGEEGGTQLAPSLQPTHCPDVSHTFPPPHAAPAGMFPRRTQRGWAVEQSIP